MPWCRSGRCVWVPVRCTQGNHTGLGMVQYNEELLEAALKTNPAGHPAPHTL